jgi:tetratricopeptide (TPR) repeat protein
VTRRSAWLAATLLVAASAPAEPTVWERAREPEAATRVKATLRAEQLFAQTTDATSDPDLLRDFSLGSAALLELSGTAEQDGFRAVLLGRALLEARTGNERDAARLIERGITRLPDSDFKCDGWFDLGLAQMIVGDYERAKRAYTAALALAWEADARATIYRNRGKARMLAGRLTDAVRDFRAAVGLAQSPAVVALSHFGLGVALERSGDYPQGLREVALGAAVRLSGPGLVSESVLDLPTIRWIPEYDVNYFRALSDMALAAAADSPGRALALYEAALENWAEYLPAAEAAHDRFAAGAERHRQRCSAEVERLRAAEPARPSGGVR